MPKKKTEDLLTHRQHRDFSTALRRSGRELKSTRSRGAFASFLRNLAKSIDVEIVIGSGSEENRKRMTKAQLTAELARVEHELDMQGMHNADQDDELRTIRGRLKALEGDDVSTEGDSDDDSGDPSE